MILYYRTPPKSSNTSIDSLSSFIDFIDTRNKSFEFNESNLKLSPTINPYTPESFENFEIFDNSRFYIYSKNFESFHTPDNLRIYRKYRNIDPIESFDTSEISEILKLKISDISDDSISMDYHIENPDINIKDLSDQSPYFQDHDTIIRIIDLSILYYWDLHGRIRSWSRSDPYPSWISWIHWYF
jgi:hypothetical protein